MSQRGSILASPLYVVLGPLLVTPTRPRRVLLLSWLDQSHASPAPKLNQRRSSHSARFRGAGLDCLFNCRLESARRPESANRL